jgi:hypothetical protein
MNRLKVKRVENSAIPASKAYNLALVIGNIHGHEPVAARGWGERDGVGKRKEKWGVEVIMLLLLLPETKRFCNFMLQLLKPTPQFEICR